MFTIYDDRDHRIIPLAGGDTFGIRHAEHDKAASLVLLERTPDGIDFILFRGPESDCRVFLDRLFLALRDCNSAVISELSKGLNSALRLHAA